jgi:hypothetical protein
MQATIYAHSPPNAGFENPSLISLVAQAAPPGTDQEVACQPTYLHDLVLSVYQRLPVLWCRLGIAFCKRDRRKLPDFSPCGMLT